MVMTARAASAARAISARVVKLAGLLMVRPPVIALAAWAGAGCEQADTPDGGQAHLDAAREVAGRVAGEPGPMAGRAADQGPPGGE